MPNNIVDLANQQGNLFDPDPFRPLTGWEGFPGLGHPFFDAAAMMAGGMYAQATGHMPLGFYSQQNIYDRIQNFQFREMQQHMKEQTVLAERSQYMRFAQGLHTLNQEAFTPERQKFWGNIIDQGMKALPILSQFLPAEAFDTLAGPRGSAMLLGTHILSGGRFQTDPLTGQLGMSAAGAADLATRVYEGTFANDARFPEMKGIKAGRAGELYEALVNRGMIGVQGPQEWMRNNLRTMSPGDQAQAFRDAGIAPGTDPDTLGMDKINKLMSNPQMQTRLQQFNADRVSQTMRDMAGAVKAMEEIFGDAGHPNAPFALIMQGLEAMTHGGLTRLSPGRIENIVRQTNNLAQQTGLGIEGAMMVQAHAAAMAQSMGLDPLLAIQAAQTGVAMGGAYTTMGIGAHPGWNTPNRNQFMQMATNLTIGAAGSQLANQFGALARLAEAQGGNFLKGSKAQIYLEALRGGDAHLVAGLENFTPQEFARMIEQGTGGAVSTNQALQQLEAHNLNQEFIEKHDLGAQMKRAQGRVDIIPRLAETFSDTLRSAVHGRGGKLGRQEADELGRQLATQLSQQSPAVLASRTDRNRVMAETLRNNAGIQQILAGKSKEQQEAILAQLAESAYAAGDVMIHTRPDMQGLGTLHETLLQINPATDAATRKQIQAALIRSHMQSAVAGIAGEGVVGRLLEAVYDAKPGDDVAKIINEAAGAMGIKGELSSNLRRQMEKVGEMQQELAEQHKQVLEMPTNTEEERIAKDKALRELQAREDNIKNEIKRTRDYYERHGATEEDELEGDTGKGEDLREGGGGGAGGKPGKTQVVVKFPDDLQLRGTLIVKEGNEEREVTIDATGRPRGGPPTMVA